MNFHTELSHIDHRQLPNILIKEKKKDFNHREIKKQIFFNYLEIVRRKQKILWSISKKNFVSDY